MWDDYTTPWNISHHPLQQPWNISKTSNSHETPDIHSPAQNTLEARDWNCIATWLFDFFLSWSIHKCLRIKFWRTSFLPQKHYKANNYGDNDEQWYAAKTFIDLFDDDIDRITLSQMRNVLGGPLSMRPQWPQGSQRSICYTVTFSSPWMMLRLRWISTKEQKPSNSSA